MTVESAIQVLSFALALVSSVGGILLFLRSSAIKSYAAQRDFEHLKRNYENLSRQWAEVDDRLGRIESHVEGIERLMNLLISGRNSKD